jgi:putative tryptophan/tyrosine transport system ATP-binding protein
MRNPLLSISDVGFHSILKDIELEVYQGDCIMLIGGNGSGKSTLLKAIHGLITPTIGTIDTKEVSIASMNQDPELSTFSDLTVYENYCMAFYKQKGARKPTKEQAIAYLQSFNPTFALRIDTICKKLSGGERQALGLALCLMHEPELVLLDEHTSALDPATSKKLMDLTAHTLSQSNATAIICTHQLCDALQFGNRLLFMKQGRIAANYNAQQKSLLTKEELLSLYAS